MNSNQQQQQQQQMTTMTMMVEENTTTATSTAGGRVGNVGTGQQDHQPRVMPLYDRQILEPTPVSDMIHQQHLLYQQHQLLMSQQQQQQQNHMELQRQRLVVQQRPPNFQILNENRVVGGVSCNNYNNNHNHYSTNLGGTKRRRRIGGGIDDCDSGVQQDQQNRVGFVQEVFAHSNPRDIDEVNHSWYSKEQLATFKDDRKDVIRALKKVNFDLNLIDTSVHQLRGLEAYLSISFNKLLQRKRGEAVRTVLQVQNYQRQNNYFDDEQIRNASCQVTEWSKHRGVTIGQQDAYFNGSATTTSSSSSNSSIESTTTPPPAGMTTNVSSNVLGGVEQSSVIEQPTMVTPTTSPTVTAPKTVSTTTAAAQSTPSPF